MATKIRYNGAEIATVEAGETKVLECSGKKMVANVAVEMSSEEDTGTPIIVIRDKSGLTQTVRSSIAMAAAIIINTTAEVY